MITKDRLNEMAEEIITCLENGNAIDGKSLLACQIESIHRILETRLEVTYMQTVQVRDNGITSPEYLVKNVGKPENEWSPV